MTKRLSSPRWLFGAGVAQALLPYVIWSLYGTNPRYSHVGLTYTPLILWVVSAVAFMAGSYAAPRPKKSGGCLVLLPRYELILGIYSVVIVLLIIQTYLTMQVYGELPILSYLRGDGSISVDTANALQEQSGYGQLGLLQISLFAAHGLLLLICTYANAAKSRIPLGVVLSLPVLLLAHIGNAKRQGVVMLLVFLIVGSTIVTGRALQFLSALAGANRKRWATWVLVIGLLPVLLGLTGFLATIRTQGRVKTTGMEQYLSYLEYPLLNMEMQTKVAGLGPHSFEALGPLATLLPYKSRPVDWDMPPRAERSAPASILENIHWFWGVWGAAGFMFVLGFLAQFVYQRSSTGVFHLLSYCQIAHALFVSHSSNLFMNLIFVPVPLAMFWVMAKLTDGRLLTGEVQLLPVQLQRAAGLPSQLSLVPPEEGGAGRL